MAGGGPLGAGAGGAGSGLGGGASAIGALGSTLPVLGAGLLAGVLVGGALLASGTVSFRAPAPTAAGAQLALLACPGAGQVLGYVAPNTRVLLTGRNADGSWLQVDFPAPAVQRAWAPASELEPSGGTDGLPVTDCLAPSTTPGATPAAPSAPTVTALVTEPPAATPTPSPTATPGPTPTARKTAAPTPTPTPKPTPRPTPRPTPKPTPKPTPTPTPDQPPSGTIVGASPPYLSRLPYPGRCAEATVSVEARDDGKVVAAYLYFQPWSAPGTPAIPVQSVQMALDPASGLWTGTMYGNANWPQPTALAAVPVPYYVVLVDDAKLTTRVDPSPNYPVTEVSCHTP